MKDIEVGAASLPDPITVSGPRLVVHIQTSEKAVDDLLRLIHDLSEARKQYSTEEAWRGRDGINSAASKFSYQ